MQGCSHPNTRVCLLSRYEVHGAESSDEEEDASGSEEEGSKQEGSKQEGSGSEDDGNGSKQQHGHSHVHAHEHGGCCGGGAGCSGHHAHGHKHGGTAEQETQHGSDGEQQEEGMPAVMASGPASIYGLHSGGCMVGRWHVFLIADALCCRLPRCMLPHCMLPCCICMCMLNQQDACTTPCRHSALLLSWPAPPPPCLLPPAANGLHLRLQMGIVDLNDETLEIVAPSAIPAGQEVHNT